MMMAMPRLFHVRTWSWPWQCYRQCIKNNGTETCHTMDAFHGRYICSESV